MKSVPAIAFDYRPSRWLLIASISIGALASVAIAFCGLNVEFKLGLIALTLIHALYSLREIFAQSFARVVWHPAGHWRMRDASEREQTAELVSRVVLGSLIVLTLRSSSKQIRSIVLLPDNCNAETRRRLRIRLMRADSIDAAMT